MKLIFICFLVLISADHEHTKFGECLTKDKCIKPECKEDKICTSDMEKINKLDPKIYPTT